MPRRCRFSRAFTLIELCVVVAILAVAAAVALPALGNILAQAQLRDAAEILADDLATARRAAIARGGHVAACPSRDGHRCTPGGRWHLGWIVVDGSIVLSAHAALPGRLATRSSQARPHITFDEAGRAPGGNDTVTLCVRHRPATAVSLVISSAGRIHAEPPDRPSAAACASSRENNR